MKKFLKLSQLNQVYQADCLSFLKKLPDNSIDLLVSDPPYGYSFMGKDWDTFNEVVEPKGAYQKQKGFRKLPRNKPAYMYEFFVPIWKECLRVLKPGAFMFVMSAPRQDTLLEQTRAIKDAGFRIDFSSIYWTYASGFPKAANIGKIIDKRNGVERKIVANKKSGIGKAFGNGEWRSESEQVDITIPASPQAKALDGSYSGFQPKPAVEVIIVAMKPLSEKSYVDQALKNSKGVTWLDDCRIPYSSKEKSTRKWSGYSGGYGITKVDKDYQSGANSQGRFPANLLLSDDVLNDGKLRTSPSGQAKRQSRKSPVFSSQNCGFKSENSTNCGYGDSGSFSRYFDLDNWEAPKEIKKTFPFMIIPKASKSEKNKGCETLQERQTTGGGGPSGAHGSVKAPAKNFHPTVKPLKLMSYLIILGSRKDDIVLDPFAGSGSTCIAAKQLGRKFIGIEKEEKYCEIAKNRLKAADETMKKAA